MAAKATGATDAQLLAANVIGAVTAVPVPISLAALIVATSVITLIAVTSVPLVMGHGDGHGFRGNISGCVRALNRNRINAAGAAP